MKTKFQLVFSVSVLIIFLAWFGTEPASAYEPPKYADYFSNPEFQIYEIQEKYHKFSIPYKITNATIDRMTVDCDSLALLVYLDGGNAEGGFTINIPRKLIDAKIGTQDDEFFVLINGLEVEYEEIADVGSRTLQIPLSSSVKIIEIIATNVGMFPEPIPCGIGDESNSSYYHLLPPLKQVNSGIPIDEIRCKKGLEKIIKSSDGSPACVNLLTVPKLTERGWGTTYLDKTMTVHGTEQSVKYRIGGNATVTNITSSEETNSVIIGIDSTTTGNLIVELPRTLIDAGHSHCGDNKHGLDAPFIVLADREEINFYEISNTAEKRTLFIPFKAGTNEIEIVVTCLI